MARKKHHVFVVTSPKQDVFHPQPSGTRSICEIVAAQTAEEAREMVIAQCEADGVTPHYPVTAREAEWTERQALFSTAWTNGAYRD